MQNITRFASINPMNNKLIKAFDFISDAMLETKLATAEKGYRIHQARSFAERGRLLTKMSDILEARADEVAKVITMEMGKPLAAAKGEVMKTAGHFKYYAQNGEQFLRPKPIICSAKQAYVQYQPIGPLLCNFLKHCRCYALEFPSLATYEVWCT